ncbi:hypothetical protein [Actinospica robiniae]|uniref:hypothetical protein n=1 Tax=Actinospica robiniae TaxID=304901 RepID=UPI0004282724|nr:hypothetical protein [Actinospica robiniae]
MSIKIDELEAESAELLPGREALGRLRFSFTKTVNVTKHVNVAHVDATNLSEAVNYQSAGATAASEAVQTISITQ